MDFRVVLGCDEAFKKKAAYTFETFFQVLGLRISFSTVQEPTSDDIAIWYGRTAPELASRSLWIHASEDAARFFQKRVPYDLSKAREFYAGGERSLALFYDDRFGEDPSAVSSGDSRGRVIHVDIVASAFYFLSCWQEMTSSERDSHGRFPASASLQQKFGLLTTPIVNQYIELLRTELERLLGMPIISKPRYHGKQFAVCMTHDIDYLRKWSLGIIYRELFQYFLLGRKDRKLNERARRVRAFFKAISERGDPFISSLEKILMTERQYQSHATYFLKAGWTSKHDVSYRLSDGSMRRYLAALKSDGHEIGLHPSYNTHLDGSRMALEKQRLDEACGVKSAGVRQHFLRFQAGQTWRIQAGEGFLYDSTLGFPDHEGFRVSFCHPFRAYDVERDEPMKLWELPLVGMDGTFQSYRNKSAESGLTIIQSLIATVKKYRGVAVLLFHNTCYDDLDFPGWGKAFEGSLAFSIQAGAFVGSGKEILESYLRSANLPGLS